MREKLLELTKQKGYSINRLALEARIAPSDLYNVVKGERSFFPAWRKRVAEVLEVDEQALIEEGEQNE